MAYKIFMRAKEGPFRCDHCEYYVGAGCRNKDAYNDAVANRGGFKASQITESGSVEVQGGDCCNYYESDEKRPAVHRRPTV